MWPNCLTRWLRSCSQVDVAVLNPPRKGCDQKVLERVSRPVAALDHLCFLLSAESGA